MYFKKKTIYSTSFPVMVFSPFADLPKRMIQAWMSTCIHEKRIDDVEAVEAVAASDVREKTTNLCEKER